MWRTAECGVPRRWTKNRARKTLCCQVLDRTLHLWYIHTYRGFIKGYYFEPLRILLWNRFYRRTWYDQMDSRRTIILRKPLNNSLKNHFLLTTSDRFSILRPSFKSSGQIITGFSDSEEGNKTLEGYLGLHLWKGSVWILQQIVSLSNIGPSTRQKIPPCPDLVLNWISSESQGLWRALFGEVGVSLNWSEAFT